jgi:FAD/FMN-containing dehydrogenase
MNTEKLLSWGNYPRFIQTPHACHWRDSLPSQLNLIRDKYGSTLAYGNGRSYGDSCLAASSHVIDMRPLDRFINANWTNGVLIAEAGVSLDSILQLSIPRGWFLSVTPGTKLITLGGAIANDVHGKNHHVHGTFGCHVRQFGLLRSDSGRQTCSLQENADLFAATIGGLGLTGIIEWAEIQLHPIHSSQIKHTVERFNSLDEFFKLSKELDTQHEYTVSWIDCSNNGQTIGRGVYMAGNFANDGKLKTEITKHLNVPITPPISLINSVSLRAFNELFWRKHSPKRQHHLIGYEPFFYPLDSINNWNRIYGPKGFQQYQCLIPETKAEPTIHALLDTISKSGAGSFLAVLKRCGDMRSPGWLSFPQPGTTLALDFPHNKYLTTQVFPQLDKIVREANGRLYPAKDAHMSGEDFRNTYPAWEKLEKLRDPALNSRFWQRVIK